MGIVGPHTALVAATNPCFIGGGTSIIRPVTSPAPKISDAEVRMYSSTFTNPRLSASTPAAGEVQSSRIGRPAHRHDCKGCLGALLLTVLGEVHAHAGRRLLERLDGAEVLPHHHARLAESRSDCSGHVFILSLQDPRPCFEELNF